MKTDTMRISILINGYFFGQTPNSVSYTLYLKKLNSEHYEEMEKIKRR